MKAREVFIKLVEAMEADNGCEFDTTVPQQNLGAELVQLMMDRGWKPESVTAGLDPEVQYSNDIEAFTQGEHGDILKIIETWDGKELDELLNHIFDHG